MAEKKTKPSVTIDNVKYFVDDLTEKQKILVNHVADLDRKIGSTQFNLDQLIGGKEFFFSLLHEELKVK